MLQLVCKVMTVGQECLVVTLALVVALSLLKECIANTRVEAGLQPMVGRYAFQQRTHRQFGFGRDPPSAADRVLIISGCNSLARYVE